MSGYGRPRSRASEAEIGCSVSIVCIVCALASPNRHHLSSQRWPGSRCNPYDFQRPLQRAVNAAGRHQRHRSQKSHSQGPTTAAHLNRQRASRRSKCATPKLSERRSMCVTVSLEQAAAAWREGGISWATGLYLSGGHRLPLQQGRCSDCMLTVRLRAHVCGTSRRGDRVELYLFNSISSTPRTGTWVWARATWRCAPAYC